MKTKKNYPLVAGIGRRSLSAVVLLAVALACSGASFAQSSTGAKSADARAAAPTQTATMSAETKAEKSRGRGSHEGLKVHGHWTIEVRNPDGKLVSHTEFENGLCTTPSSNAQGLYGDYVIAQLLSGTSVPGGWVIALGNPAIPSPSNPPLPCLGSSASSYSSFSPVFALAQSGTGSSVNGPCSSWSSLAACSPSLSSPTVSGSYPIALTLSGSFTVPSGTAATIVTDVGTFLGYCPGTSVTTCQSLGPGGFQITGTYLAPPQVATPVTVSGGQMVTVSVQLSFS